MKLELTILLILIGFPKVFTGCFANTSLGLKIVDCDSCFCELRNESAGTRAGLEHVSKRGQGREVTAKICMER